MQPDELARYSRQIILPQIGLEGQERLHEARVLLIGMGGLGSPAALYLAAAGVGTLGLADFDTVAAHNLQRQVLHDDARVGSPKTESARARLLALNPRLQLEIEPRGVQTDNAVSLFSRYDVIVDGTDNFPTRYLNNDAAFLAQRPLVYGSVFQFEGQVSVFHPAGGGPCYRCLFPTMPEAGTVPNCEEAGVFGALCGVIGSWQAMEAIKLLTGAGTSLRGRLQILDALHGETRAIRLKPDPECPLCGAAPTIRGIEASNYEWQCAPEAAASENMSIFGRSKGVKEISVQEAAAAMQRGALLLDVREDYEHAIAQVPGSRLLPMGRVPEAVDVLPKDQPILCLCHHGVRSLRVAKYLQSAGFAEVANVSGGIDQWAVHVDPSLQRY
ncbi:MAG: molybdopterin-synthase adenylyltransferase MoeB [Opitutales bacterium]